MKKYNIVELFAGIGGLGYGFSQIPEFNILAANEIDEKIAKSYEINHPDVEMLICDIADLTEGVLNKAIGDKKVDVVLGGPPCQSYSTLGKRQLDERANLFLQYKRILKVLKPKCFVYENVVGL
ncbi:MAG: DNA cytosine methyltransferase, partial [Bacteroidales bacterium]|nr:DNA cytosine methyltransferase [Bacteroidales bacterium]